MTTRVLSDETIRRIESGLGNSTIAEAAAFLKLSVRTLTRWGIKGKLTSYKVGRKIIIRNYDLRQLINPSTIKSKTQRKEVQGVTP